jgi:hypothetical protein
MCSSVFGPAIVPSFVMWPMRKTGIARRFAAAMRSPAVSRTWPTEPATDPFRCVCIVWIESMMTAEGRDASIDSMIRSTEVSAKREIVGERVPRRRARRAIWRGDSSPDT